ncbi:MAG: hydrogenase expression/formation protein HupK [Natronohydrobacter sp.]|nr:hydrogenase expression/formation protein HupK [Natronohydrobacter sp.]
MQGALQITHDGQGWVFDLPDPPALGTLLRGKPVAEAADLLPRLFNLCGAAQGIAARLSLGLPIAPDANATLAREVLRDHLLALFVTLPRAATLAPQPLPAGWQTSPDLAPALWGGARPVLLAQWLAAGQGLAPLVARFAALFGAQGSVPPLPFVTLDNVDSPAALENSPAARHAADPLMRQAETLAGRGPLWRLLGRIIDAEAAAQAHLPDPELRADGMALVPAARGSYALRLQAHQGRITTICRITPTDHMLAPGGTLRQALGTLDQPALAPLLIALHDPCLPVKLPEVGHA